MNCRNNLQRETFQCKIRSCTYDLEQHPSKLQEQACQGHHTLQQIQVHGSFEYGVPE
jgi:hypothetical protein